MNTTRVDAADKRPGEVQPSRRVLPTMIGAFFVFIAIVGVYLPGIPTTGPLLLGCYLLGKGNPEMRERVLARPLFARYRGYVDGTREFTFAIRCWAIACMWFSIGASTLMMNLSGMVGSIGVYCCVVSGFIGTVVIARFGRRSTVPAFEEAPSTAETAQTRIRCRYETTSSAATSVSET